MSNAFLDPSVAGRYAQARPYFQPRVMAHIRAHLGLHGLLPSALDVACGTGNSTAALQLLAQAITGTDVSVSMLTQARLLFPELRFIEASAEHLPFEDSVFDLVTVSMAFNAFDQALFLQEAHRVLRQSGWLVLYQSEFRGEMQGKSDFQAWFASVFASRFPQPPSPTEPLFIDVRYASGFRIGQLESFTSEVTWTAENLVEYLTTLGRVIVTLEEGKQSFQAVREWLLGQFLPLFSAESATFKFSGYVRFLHAQTKALP